VTGRGSGKQGLFERQNWLGGKTKFGWTKERLAGFLLPSPFDIEEVFSQNKTTVLMHFSRLNIHHQTSSTPKPCPITIPQVPRFLKK